MIAEQRVSLASDGIVLDARLHLVDGATAGVVMCHPHPLYGGDMDNIVVMQVVQACAAEGLATLRFNFRGVGESTGSHDGGRGEQHDLDAALDHLAARLAAPRGVAAAGYSFGARVAAVVTGRRADLAGLALIAPPLGMSPDRFDGLTALSVPLLVVAGTRDDICPTQALDALATTLPRAEIRRLEGADHSFGGCLDSLADAVRGWARALRPGDAAGRGRTG